MEPTNVNFHKLKTMNFLFNDTFGSGRARRIDLLPWTRFFYDECYQRLQEAMAIRNKFWQEQLPHINVSLQVAISVVYFIFIKK